MQIWIHDNKMKKITALNNDVPDMLSYTNSTWHSYLDQATSTFDFTIPKFSNGELHEDLKLINDECFVSFYVNGSYQVFYIATLQEDDFNIQLTCNNTNLEYALEYANPFSADGAQTIEWYLNHMDLLSFAAVEIGINEISDRKRTLTFDSQETKMNRLQSLMSNFDAEFEFKVELNRDGTYKRIVINIYQEADDTHHGIGTDRKDVVLYYSNGLKGVQVSSDKTQMFNAAVFTGKDGLSLNDVEISEKNADGIEEFYSRKGNPCLYAPIAMNRYPATMRAEGQDNWIRKDFTTEYENVNDLKAYALRTLKKYAYPLVTYTASVQSGFVSHYTDLKLGDTIRIIDKNFVGGLALEARVSEMIISFDNPANNSFVFTNYRKLDNKPSSALQTRIEQAVESKLPYRIELATTGGVTFKNNEGETIIKPSLYKGNLPWTKDVTWHWTLNGVVTDGVQYRIQARDIIDTAVLTVDAFVGGKKVATTEITLTNVNDGLQGPQGPQGDEGPQGPQGDTGNGIANTVVTYGLSMSDTTEPATWSSEMPALVKGMYLWTRTVIIYTNGESTTSYQISYIPQDADATAEIDKAKQELLEKLETVRDDSLAAVEEAKQGLTNVASELNTAKQDLQNAVSAVDTKATNLQSDLSQAKQDLTSQAQQLQTQANAQTELSKRVTTVESTANGTKTTVNELSKTVAQNGKDITSVTARTKTVEDDLTSTKTTLSQVKTTAESTSKKTATLETGLNGLNAKFDSLKVGSVNLLKNSKAFKGSNITGVSTLLNETYNDCAVRYFKNTNPNSNYQDYAQFLSCVIPKSEGEYVVSFWAKGSGTTRVFFYNGLPVDSFVTSQGVSGDPVDGRATFTLSENWERYCVKYKLRATTEQQTVAKNLLFRHDSNSVEDETYLSGVQLEEGNIATDYSPNEADIEQKVAEYKQTADQNYASLQTTVQNLDGTVQHNKTVAEQTAAGFKTRIESLETYKDGETTRANQYFELAKTETARQLTAERTAIAKDYVAKSTYTSDVTGIRNDLTATTTTANTIKTNLANYQASNDRAVANLQSNMQTANGNISSLKTKVEAVPGQITSAVSAVESKIPTNLDSLNLMTGTRDWSTKTNAWHMGANWSTESDEFQGLKVHSTQKGWNGSHQNIFVKNGDVVTFSFFAKATNTLPGIAIKSTWSYSSVYQAPLAGVKESDEEITVTNGWKRYSKTVHITSDGSLQFRTEYNDATIPDGNTFYVAGLKLAKSSQDTGYSENPTDAASDITKLSTSLTQTANGLEQLSTKVTSQGNSISTHTTQISALNTGLQAKVSQTDFNTLSGRVTTAENNITAKANELSSKITTVEGKIPTEIGAVNLLKNSKTFTGSNITGSGTILSETYQGCSVRYYAGANFCDIAQFSNCVVPKIGSTYVVSFWAKGSGKVRTYFYGNTNYLGVETGTTNQNATTTANDGSVDFSLTANWQRYWVVYKLKPSFPTSDTTVAKHLLFRYLQNGASTDNVHIAGVKLEEGNVASGYEPAPEDTAEQISSLSSELKQTKDGITLLATKTELNTAKNELQSGINTATNKANAAQNTANSAQSTANSAQNKANNNAQTISTHTTQISALNTGLQAKVSQTDFNTLSGRVTSAENNITAKANELSSKISSVEGKLPSGETNLVEYGRPANGYSPYAGAEYTTHGFYYNGAYKMYIIKNSTTSEKMLGMNRFKVERNTDYTLYFKGFNNSSITNIDVWFLKRVNGSKNDWDSAQILVDARKLSNARAEDISVTFNTGEYDEGYLRFDNNGVTTAGTRADLYFGDVSVKKGKSNSGWSPSLAELASSQALKTAQSEFKQTTDAIKASVTSLDKSTVKSSSLTINSDGIVMKAGKSTTDVANAIGSYFAVNQNAINLFSDKINVKGNMIVDGAITGDKIQANSVDVSKIVGIDADFIKSKIEYAMIDWLKGKTITAYNDNMTIDLQDGRISFKDGSNAIYRQTPDGIHTGFLHFEAGSQGGIYAAFGATSTRQGINSKSSEFAGIRCYRVSANGDSHEAKIDKIEVIGDTVQFGHGYRSDGSIGGGFIMDNAAFANETPYSLNRVVKSIESLWRILHDHAKNTGYRFNDPAFINALNNEYNAWHEMHND